MSTDEEISEVIKKSMPKPKSGESKNKYIDRAIDYFVHQEGRSVKESVGRAEGFWKSYGGKKKGIKKK